MMCQPRPSLIGLLVLALAMAVFTITPDAAFRQADPRNPAPALDGFDAEVARAVADWKVPGLAIAVVADDEVAFAKGYGVRRLGEDGTVDERTLFAVGSTTKAMTAAALGMLKDEGRLQWTDAVRTHLPWFELHDRYATRETTVRDLLTHRAGLGNADFLWYEQDGTTEAIVRRLRFLPPATSMRSHFTYQNVMYAAAGETVAAVAGMPWSRFVETRLFEPLGMRDTVPTADRLAARENVAAPHYEIEGTIEVIRNASVDSVAAAGSVWSSVADMARWMRMLLNRGRLGPDGATLLSAETIAEMFTPQVIVGSDGFYPTATLTGPNWTTYGLGWFQADYRGHKVDFHTGSIDGMVAIVGLLRDRRVGVCVLANLDHAEVRHALMYRVFDRYLGGAERDWSGELRTLYAGLADKAAAAREERRAKRVAGTTPSVPLEAYAGAYTDPLYGTVTIASRDGRLHAAYGRGFTGPLEHWHYDTFEARWDARWRGTTQLTFGRGQDGGIATLEMNGWRFTRQREAAAR